MTARIGGWLVGTALVGATIGCGERAADVPGGEPIPAPAPSIRTALERAEVVEAWKGIFLAPDAQTRSPEALKADFEALIGAPARVEGDTKLWFAVEGDACFRVSLFPDGNMSTKPTEAADCGG